MAFDFKNRMYLSARDIYEMVGVCRGTFDKRIKPHLVKKKVGRCVFYSVELFVRYLEQP